jgi:hypothetical protein
MKKYALLSASLLAVAAPLFGCAGAQDDTQASDVEGRTGSLRMALVGTAPSGNSYRLTDAIFTVTDSSGPVTSLDSDADPDATSIIANLEIGNYQVAINDEWSLQDVDSGNTVTGKLLTPAVQDFSIGEDETTIVVYRFRVGNEVVVFGGTLEIAVEVEEGWEAAYVRGQSAPWGVNTNEQAMDLAFGAGEWDDLRMESVDPEELFSNAYDFIYLEGGQYTALELAAFLEANIELAEDWVDAGGALFLNAAPTEGDDIDFGFGGVTLVYLDTAVNPGRATDAEHPIWNGPALPTVLTYNGNFLGHASVTIEGPGLVSLMEDNTDATILAELPWGDGNVIFGGLTTTNWWTPSAEALNVRANILSYLANE